MNTKRLQTSIDVRHAVDRRSRNSPRSRAARASTKAKHSAAASSQNERVRPGKVASMDFPNLSGNHDGGPLRSLPIPVNPQTMRNNRLIASKAPQRDQEVDANFILVTFYGTDPAL